MSGVRFDFNIAEVDKKFDAWARKFRQKKKIHAELAKYEYARTVNRIITTKRDPFDEAWERLSGYTVRDKVRRATAQRGILWDEGDLLRSIQVGVTRDSFIIGSNLDYAEFLQEGTRNMPAREFIGFNDEIEDDFYHLIEMIVKK